MATKILTYAALFLGTPSLFFGYILNRATWKNDVLFLFGLTVSFVMLVLTVIDRYDKIRIRRRQMRAEAKREEWEEKIRSMYGPGDDLNHGIFN